MHSMVVKKPPLTEGEKKWLKAFLRAKKKAGMSPDLHEVAAEMKATRQAAHEMLGVLVAKGRLEKVKRYRGYRLVKRAA